MQNQLISDPKIFWDCRICGLLSQRAVLLPWKLWLNNVGLCSQRRGLIFGRLWKFLNSLNLHLPMMGPWSWYSILYSRTKKRDFFIGFKSLVPLILNPSLCLSPSSIDSPCNNAFIVELDYIVINRLVFGVCYGCITI